MKWVVSVFVLFLFGCSQGPIHRTELQQHMLPGIEDSYKFNKVFDGKSYSYYKAVSYEPVHADVIYYAVHSRGTLLLNSENLWTVLSEDDFSFKEISKNFALYLFDMEFPEYVLVGGPEMWKENPFYCDGLNEMAVNNDIAVFASIYNEFVEVEYKVEDGVLSNSIYHYKCEV